jgi:phosphohistidine phosphatase
MKKLLILRHAKSSWQHSGLTDHQRPLNPRGEKSAPRMGQFIYEIDLVPEAILSSTARRAAETAELVAESCGFAGDIQYFDAFYHGWPSSFVEILQRLPKEIEIAMVVAHNPGLEALLETLTGALEALPTAALAYVKLPINDWSQLTEETEGKLSGFWRVRDLLNP